VTEKAPAANPAADSLLDKYLAAVGGSDALKKNNKTRVAKGTVTAFGDSAYASRHLFQGAGQARFSDENEGRRQA